MLEQRFDLRKTRYLCERFKKSPNITEECSVADHLGICYSAGDASIITSVRELFLRTYMYVKDWFDYRGDIAIDLWVAPETVDLQYMTCLSCGDGFASAPGSRNGKNVILFVSPLSGGKNADKDRFSGMLAHEITHHFVTDISHATIFYMKRKEERNVPVWIEEGLCQLIQSEVDPSFRMKCDEDIARPHSWQPLQDVWNDLSSCEDVDTAYLQAYEETKTLVEKKGKAEIIRLLHLNRTHSVDWSDLTCKGKKSKKDNHEHGLQLL